MEVKTHAFMSRNPVFSKASVAMWTFNQHVAYWRRISVNVRVTTFTIDPTGSFQRIFLVFAASGSHV